MLSTSSTEQVYVELVDVPERLRPINEAQVEAIAHSMKEIGLQTPISVRVINDGERIVLVAGRHRLEAAKRLGLEKIRVDFVEGDEDDFRLWEIAENLHRAELTVLERSEHIAEWVRLTNKQVGQVAQPQKGGKQPADKGISSASREIGVERTDARRALKIDSIAPAAKQAARDAGLDRNQSALLRVAAAEPERQAEVVRLVASAGSVADFRRAQAQPATDEAVERITADRRLEPEDGGTLGHLATPSHAGERTVTYPAWGASGREERTVTFPAGDSSGGNPMVAHLRQCWKAASQQERAEFLSFVEMEAFERHAAESAIAKGRGKRKK